MAESDALLIEYKRRDFLRILGSGALLALPLGGAERRSSAARRRRHLRGIHRESRDGPRRPDAPDAGGGGGNLASL